MANKKNEEVKNTTKKKTTTTANKNNKTTAKKSTTTKSNTTKKNNVKKSTTTTKKSATTKKSTIKKSNTNKKIVDKNVIVEENVINLEEKIEFPDNYVNKDNNNISEQEKDEKIIVEEINNVTKLENAKYIKNKKSNLLPIGVVIAILGLIALIISLVANRIVDREYLSDTAITLMLIISIVIETFGAFIIINES